MQLFGDYRNQRRQEALDALSIVEGKGVGPREDLQLPVPHRWVHLNSMLISMVGCKNKRRPQERKEKTRIWFEGEREAKLL
jgi:hypothetical protein